MKRGGADEGPQHRWGGAMHGCGGGGGALLRSTTTKAAAAGRGGGVSLFLHVFVKEELKSMCLCVCLCA
jgi:hypothetical protein